MIRFLNVRNALYVVSVSVTNTKGGREIRQMKRYNNIKGPNIFDRKGWVWPWGRKTWDEAWAVTKVLALLVQRYRKNKRNNYQTVRHWGTRRDRVSVSVRVRVKWGSVSRGTRRGREEEGREGGGRQAGRQVDRPTRVYATGIPVWSGWDLLSDSRVPWPVPFDDVALPLTFSWLCACAPSVLVQKSASVLVLLFQ